VGILKVEQKVVDRSVCYFSNIHHFDIVLNRIHLVKVNARLRVELLAWPGRVDSNRVLDNFFPWICFWAGANHVDHSMCLDVSGAESCLERSLLAVRCNWSVS
jgi:hypothetical protein